MREQRRARIGGRDINRRLPEDASDCVAMAPIDECCASRPEATTRGQSGAVGGKVGGGAGVTLAALPPPLAALDKERVRGRGGGQYAG